MKRWDVFDFLLGEARSQRLQFRLEKDPECDTFYFDDPLQCSVNGRRSSVALAIVRAQGLPDGPFCQADWAGYWREHQDELSLAERGTQMLFKWKGR